MVHAALVETLSEQNTDEVERLEEKVKEQIIPLQRHSQNGKSGRTTA